MLKGRRILLVEDDEIMGASIAQRLDLEGAEVQWVKQVVRAIPAVRTPRAPVDAVICDIRLPGRHGRGDLHRAQPDDEAAAVPLHHGPGRDRAGGPADARGRRRLRDETLRHWGLPGKARAPDAASGNGAHAADPRDLAGRAPGRCACGRRGRRGRRGPDPRRVGNGQGTRRAADSSLLGEARGAARRGEPRARA